MQKFGSAWTQKKLDVLEEYLASYTKIMKKQSFKLYYIDAFSGSGNIKIKDGKEIVGSAVRSLKYSFDYYYFFDLDKTNCDSLTAIIEKDYPDKKQKISIMNTDCNEMLQKIAERDWIKNNWRGVIFLDPYAMQLSWESLENVSKTRAIDVWYFFPFYALNRNLQTKGIIPDSSKKAISRLLGTDKWEEEIYKESLQLTLFGESTLEKTDTEGLRKYIIKRLSQTFPAVSDKAALLNNEKNAPIFLLCFAGSNPSEKAKEASLRVANHLLSNIGGERDGVKIKN
jgi:three-Cys-motif partner protein